MADKLIQLALDIVGNKPFGEFSVNDMEDTLREQISTLVCNDRGELDEVKWDQNHKAIFAMFEALVDEKLPMSLKNVFGKSLIEVKTFKDGERASFTIKTGKRNLKRFVTKAAAAGVYERARLDAQTLELPTFAVGGAVYQKVEHFLSGKEKLSEALNALLFFIEEAIYEDAVKMLETTINNVPAANKHIGAGFNRSQFVKIMSVVKTYGTPTIFCTEEFAANLTLDPNFIGDLDKSDMRNYGYIGKYLGANVSIITQSFLDDQNTQKAINPAYAYIIPAGSNEAPIKIALEGKTRMRKIENADWTTEFQVYKKVGVGMLNTNKIGIYKDTDLG